MVMFGTAAAVTKGCAREASMQLRLGVASGALISDGLVHYGPRAEVLLRLGRGGGGERRASLFAVLAGLIGALIPLFRPR